MNDFKNPWEITDEMLANPWEMGGGRSVLDRDQPKPEKKSIIGFFKISSKNTIFIDKIFSEIQKLTNKKLALLTNGTIVIHNDALKNIQISGLKGNGFSSGIVLIDSLLSSTHPITIFETLNNNITKPKNASKFNHCAPPDGVGTGSGVDVYYNSAYNGNDILNEDNTTGRPPFIGLYHELLHAKKVISGKVNPTFYKCKIPVFTNNQSNFLISYLTKEEIETREEENIIRKDISEKKRKLPKIISIATYSEVENFIKDNYKNNPEGLQNAIPKQNKANK
jgi:Effector protein